METICHAFVTVLLLYFVKMSGTTQICTAVDQIGNTRTGMKLHDKSFLYQNETSYMFCARLCGRHTLCRSFNWDQNQYVCELNYDHDGHFMTDNRFIFTNITEWPDFFNDACSNHNCPINTRCEVTSSGGFTCVVIGCSGVPQVSNVNTTSFAVASLWKFNDVVPYPCNRDFYPSVNATCASNGTWSNFTCSPITCSEVFTCNGNAEGGEYWIRPQNFDNVIRVYCEPSSGYEYITLSEYNMASKSPLSRNKDSCDLHDVTPYRDHTGYTDYQKVRLVLLHKRLAINDGLFSNSSSFFQNYGNAGDCLNHGTNCSVVGTFVVDLGGTSFRVNQSTTWEEKEQNATIESIIFSNNATRVVGKCGGNCGGCRPNGNRLYIESNPYFQPPDESAQHVLCPFSIIG